MVILERGVTNLLRILYKNLKTLVWAHTVLFNFNFNLSAKIGGFFILKYIFAIAKVSVFLLILLVKQALLIFSLLNFNIINALIVWPNKYK